MSELIEISVKKHLENELGIPVYMEFPENAPERFVIVDRTDGSRENLIDSGVILAQSYAESKLEAAILNTKVKSAMDRLTALNRVSACNLSGDYPFPDNKRKRHRYQAVYNITYY